MNTYTPSDQFLIAFLFFAIPFVIVSFLWAYRKTKSSKRITWYAVYPVGTDNDLKDPLTEKAFSSGAGFFRIESEAHDFGQKAHSGNYKIIRIEIPTK